MKEIKAQIMLLEKDKMVELSKWLSDYLNLMSRRSFSKGDKVYFTSNKYGRINGIVKRVNQKTITLENTVSEDGKKWLGWKVSPNLLFEQ